MRTEFLHFLMCFVICCTALSLAAQDSDENNGKKSKDGDSQTKFLYEDMEAEDFNYSDRKKISKPLMPSYDRDTSVSFYESKKKTEQQQAYENREYYYPAKPKNQSELGIGIGSALISGDVRSTWNPLENYAGMLTFRRSFGYVFSVRAQYMYAKMHGQNWKSSANSRFNQALNGTLYNTDDGAPYTINYVSNDDLNLGGRLNSYSNDPNSDIAQRRNMNNLLWHNYQTELHELSVSGVITLGNIKFHKERNKTNIYTFFTVGVNGYHTKMDVVDESTGDIYDYSRVAASYYEAINSSDADGNNSSLFKNAARQETLDLLDQLQDGSYETVADQHKNEKGVGKYLINPIAGLGLGVAFHLSKRISLNLESRVAMTNDDLLDGQRLEEDYLGGFTRGFDTYWFNGVTFGFHLGKKGVEPLWWLNPMHHTYKKVGDMDPESIINDLLEDDDEDGVPNRLDDEENTPKGAPVNPAGIALDSDGDGIIDLLDKEPFSSPGYPIDANGVADVPVCCDNLEVGGANCDKIDLPSVHFNSDKFYVDPAYYAHLHTIAEKMQMCPDLRVVADGYTDQQGDQKYNEQLSWNRVNASIEYLVEKYGIDRDRFLVKFSGQAEGDENNAFDRMRDRKVEFRFADDGESGDSNPPAPHPGLKAGSDR